jgi:hypothetical protein
MQDTSIQKMIFSDDKLQYIFSTQTRYTLEYSIQHYVIKIFSDLRQVVGFHQVLLFPPPIKLTATI